MNKKDVYKIYGWDPSEGDYKSPDSNRLNNVNTFSILVIRIYKKLMRVITLKFFFN